MSWLDDKEINHHRADAIGLNFTVSINTKKKEGLNSITQSPKLDKSWDGSVFYIKKIGFG